MIQSYSSAFVLQIDKVKLSPEDQANGERFFLNTDGAIQVESGFAIAGGLIHDKRGN